MAKNICPLLVPRDLTKKLAHWVDLLGQLLPQKHVLKKILDLNMMVKNIGG